MGRSAIHVVRVGCHTLLLAIPILATLYVLSADPAMAQSAAVPVSNSDLVRQCEHCLSLLLNEAKSPARAIMGDHGGPVDSGYLQCGEIRSFCIRRANFTDEERIAIRNWASDVVEREGQSNKNVREMLALVVGRTRDTSVVPQLVDILLNHPECHMRCMAAIVLGDIRDPASIPALEQALKTDTYARVRLSSCVGPRLSRKEMVYSPTRDEAAGALRRMGVSVATGAEVVDARYVVPRLEPLLYSDRAPYHALMFLASIEGPEAEGAVTRFIESKRGDSSAGFWIDYALGIQKTARAVDLPSEAILFTGAITDLRLQESSPFWLSSFLRSGD